ncbi:hypothetical protein LVD15_06885 [Fulvivirga maritima]|uniref:hypothetical protein n=1 Tax=Fulvivirga maritima TaxID=2904247 RepID=UPI001F2F9EF5|nr:hypothetical protein [Fulvivirga maritima]UII28143.1 hypothetical protein LVD15_06885 [Fulvivirga maritima]
MKTLIQTSALALIAVFMMSVSVMAASPDKTTEKAREAVSKAAPDDWYTLAESAEMCFKKGVNLKEAKQWLDTSLQIKESAFAHEVAGDYYMSYKLYEKAITSYVNSMKLLKQKDFYADTDALQAKIDKANKKL